MAAEVAVLVSIGAAMASALLKPVLKKCGDAVSNTDSAAGLKSALSGNLKPKLVELEAELRQLVALLSHARSLNPVKQTDNDLLSPWLKRIKKAANFADDLLDDISYDQLRRQVESNRGTSFAFRRKIGSKLNKFKSMTAKIYKEAAEIGISLELVAKTTPPSSYQAPAAMSTDLREIRENVDTSTVVGRQHDEYLILRELCRPTDNQVLGFIAIVGMSGVGKTTLVRKIYDNETVTKIYKHKSWIFASQDFNLKRLLDEMLQSLTVGSHIMTNTEAMEKKLCGCLQRDSYLLVLDDVWNTNKQVWDSIRNSLVRVTNGCTGSKVLVTTQSYEVASVINAYMTHRVEVISKYDAWALFQSKAFANKSQHQVLELREIGARILRKCGGLPLAINTLASLLASMDERSQWESVDRSQVWNLPSETKIMPWLLLSFNHLPSVAVKQCFAHCSMIPKGFQLREEMLIESWIAHGFIQPSETSDDSTVVDIGRMYIKSILANNLLQSVEHTKPKQFTMHDLIHDLALYVSMDSSVSIMDYNDLHKAVAGAEHVSIYSRNTCNSILHFPEGNTQSTLRTLICINATISVSFVAQARFLRQLHLIRCGLVNIPCSIGGLKHLRILDLKDNPFKYLPETIGRLYKLHVLCFERCRWLVELPRQVTKLLNLRMISTTEAVHIPKGMGQLKSLMWLPVVKLKAGDGCKIKELRSLLQLRGEVTIMQLENISSKEEALLAGLKSKEGITNLKLIWTCERGEDDIVCCSDEEVMEGLQPHLNLEVLVVANFCGKSFSTWLSDGLYCNKLMRLTLFNCKRCQLPTLGCLPCIKSVYIDGMESVEVIGTDFFAYYSLGMSQSQIFPSLKELQLLNMPRLKEWFDPSGFCVSAFPSLEDLSIINCPPLVGVPTCFHSLKRLTVKGINSGEPLLMILSNSYKLTSLTVENVHQLTCLSQPLLQCTHLRLLNIRGCNALVELPPTLQSLDCLETLDVRDCATLTSLPDIEGLMSLRRLDIVSCDNIADTPRGLESCVSIEVLQLVGCPKLNSIPDISSLRRLQFMAAIDFLEQMSIPQWTNQLSSLILMGIGGFNKELDDFHGIDQLPKCLIDLTLRGWPKLKYLPNELQSLTQLENLHLWGFEGVVELPEWLGNLSSLQFLDILDCKYMKHLPPSDAMRRLTRLRQLRIRECPTLEERCRKEGGEEWPKISHLPTILINK